MRGDSFFISGSLAIAIWNGFIGVSKVKFFRFSGTKTVKQNQKKLKNHLKPTKLVRQPIAE